MGSAAAAAAAETTTSSEINRQLAGPGAAIAGSCRGRQRYAAPSGFSINRFLELLSVPAMWPQLERKQRWLLCLYLTQTLSHSCCLYLAMGDCSLIEAEKCIRLLHACKTGCPLCCLTAPATAPAPFLLLYRYSID